jgi:hypothetical protein
MRRFILILLILCTLEINASWVTNGFAPSVGLKSKDINVNFNPVQTPFLATNGQIIYSVQVGAKATNGILAPTWLVGGAYTTTFGPVPDTIPILCPIDTNTYSLWQLWQFAVTNIPSVTNFHGIIVQVTNQDGTIKVTNSTGPIVYIGGVTGGEGGSGSQTPWTNNENGVGFSLTNVATVAATANVTTPTLTVSNGVSGTGTNAQTLNSITITDNGTNVFKTSTNGPTSVGANLIIQQYLTQGYLTFSGWFDTDSQYPGLFGRYSWSSNTADFLGKHYLGNTFYTLGAASTLGGVITPTFGTRYQTNFSGASFSFGNPGGLENSSLTPIAWNELGVLVSNTSGSAITASFPLTWTNLWTTNGLTANIPSHSILLFTISVVPSFLTNVSWSGSLAAGASGIVQSTNLVYTTATNGLIYAQEYDGAGNIGSIGNTNVIVDFRTNFYNWILTNGLCLSNTFQSVMQASANWVKYVFSVTNASSYPLSFAGGWSPGSLAAGLTNGTPLTNGVWTLQIYVTGTNWQSSNYCQIYLIGPNGAGSGGGSSGTVTSVTFTGDGVVDSSTPSSAVTTTGTVTATIKTQTANTVLAGPTSGGAVAPTFRALVAADIPSGIGPTFSKQFASYAGTTNIDAGASLTNIVHYASGNGGAMTFTYVGTQPTNTVIFTNTAGTVMAYMTTNGLFYTMNIQTGPNGSITTSNFIGTNANFSGALTASTITATTGFFGTFVTTNIDTNQLVWGVGTYDGAGSHNSGNGANTTNFVVNFSTNLYFLGSLSNSLCFSNMVGLVTNTVAFTRVTFYSTNQQNLTASYLSFASNNTLNVTPQGWAAGYQFPTYAPGMALSLYEMDIQAFISASGATNVIMRLLPPTQSIIIGNMAYGATGITNAANQLAIQSAGGIAVQTGPSGTQLDLSSTSVTVQANNTLAYQFTSSSANGGFTTRYKYRYIGPGGPDQAMFDLEPNMFAPPLLTYITSNEFNSSFSTASPSNYVGTFAQTNTITISTAGMILSNAWFQTLGNGTNGIFSIKFHVQGTDKGGADMCETLTDGFAVFSNCPPNFAVATLVAPTWVGPNAPTITAACNSTGVAISATDANINPVNYTIDGTVRWTWQK